MNYKDLYLRGLEELSGAGIAEAPLDARLLLEHICSTDRNALLVYGEQEVPEAQRKQYVNCIARRKAREPLQHITGEQEFMGLVFEVNKDVLIPRQDTEILVEEVLRFLQDKMTFLDMCTGSGCILLSLMYYANGCKGTGADISGRAVETAKRNAQRLQNSGRFSEDDVCLVISDLFGQVEGKFDIIVSNPPYIPTAVIPSLMEEVKDFEPVNALDGRTDGLFFYERITGQAAGYLNGGGYLFYEIGSEQAEAVGGLMEKAGYKDVTVVKDYAGLDRVVYGRLCN